MNEETGVTSETLYNRRKRWGERDVLSRMMEGLATTEAKPKTVLIDATYLKAHRKASVLLVKKVPWSRAGTT